MQHYRSIEQVNVDHAWVTIGIFDGVHKGHQAVVSEMVQAAHSHNSPAVVVTFFPHPSVVLGKRNSISYLTSPEERASLLGALGVDIVITQPFTLQVAETSAYDFVSLLHDRLHMQEMWVGYDFALGKGREGDTKRLKELGKTFGYRLHITEPVRIDGEIVSSSLIRKALEAGEVEKASKLLGRPYEISGQVIHGDGRGRTIGIPTANLDVPAERVIPKAGVYVCKATVMGADHGAVTNIGVRPTFDNPEGISHVEAHILDFNQDLYGQKVALKFLARLRDEQRFESIQALIDQIHADIARGREVLQQR